MMRTEAKQQEIERLILEAASASESERAALDAALEELGVYRFPAEECGNITTYSSNSDVIVNAPSIYYTPADQTWTVSTGGYWIDSIPDEAPGTVYVTQDIGDPDAFGVGYSNTSGTFSTRALHSAGSINNNKTGSYYVGKTTSNRSDGDTKSGFRLSSVPAASIAISISNEIQSFKAFSGSDTRF